MKASAELVPVEVAIRDAISRAGIAAAYVKVSARGEKVRADGSIQLDPLSASLELISGRSDDQGLCRLNLSASTNCHWIAVECQASGYSGQILALAKVAPGPTNLFYFDLLPEEISPSAAARLEEKRILEKLGLWMKQADVDQRESTSSQSEGRPGFRAESMPTVGRTIPYPVTEQVYVKSLAEVDYTGWMDLEELVAGTVTAEMNDGFPFEALKAQAVASRTYCLDRFQRRGQANGGQAYTARIGAKSLTATRNTVSIVMLYNGTPITAYFSARCNGDYTLNSEEGVTLSDCRLGSLGAGVVPWARSRACSGHANCAATAEPCCDVAVRGKVNHIYGHGVGLCQRGAQELAGRDGWGWDSILLNYYTGIVIANGSGVTVGSTVVTSTRVNVRGEACGSSIVNTVPAETKGVITSGPRRPTCALASPYGHLTWWEVSLSDRQRGWMAEDYLRLMPQEPLVLRLDWQRIGGKLVLSWPSNSLDEVLQQTPRVGPAASWVAPALPSTFSNGLFRVNLDATNDNRFFRLMTR